MTRSGLRCTYMSINKNVSAGDKASIMFPNPPFVIVWTLSASYKWQPKSGGDWIFQTFYPSWQQVLFHFGYAAGI